MHATKVKKFGHSAVIFPYEMLFRAVNTHLLVNEGLNGEYDHDSGVIYAALRDGHCFVGYDHLPQMFDTESTPWRESASA